MRTFDPKLMGVADFYRLLSATVAPRPIAWLSTVAADGTPNLAPFSFFNVVSNDPPTLMISIGNRGDGRAKDSLANLDREPGCTVSLVSMPHFEQMWVSSLDHEPQVSEFEVADVAVTAAERVAAPRIADAPVTWECVRTGRIEIGSYTVNLLRIECLHLRPELIDANGRVDLAGLQAIGRISNKFLPVEGIFEPPA